MPHDENERDQKIVFHTVFQEKLIFRKNFPNRDRHFKNIVFGLATVSQRVRIRLRKMFRSNERLRSFAQLFCFCFSHFRCKRKIKILGTWAIGWMWFDGNLMKIIKLIFGIVKVSHKYRDYERWFWFREKWFHGACAISLYSAGAQSFRCSCWFCGEMKSRVGKCGNEMLLEIMLT